MEILQTFEIVMSIINSVSPMGVLFIVVVGWVILPRLKFLQKFLNNIGVCKKCADSGNQDLAPILLRLTSGIEKISGNDLSHIKADIERMEEDLGLKMDSINERFLRHDAQAKAILSRANDIWGKIERRR